MSQLLNFFNSNTHRNGLDKWMHYFEIYEFWFSKFKNKPIVILEIGVYQGGSINMWREYFGSEAAIYAIDINPLCKQFETENTKIFIGSQDDRDFLKYVKSQIPKIDILIDDGGHMMDQQIISFEELYEHVKIDGLYLCEDLHTSYWEIYGGGYKEPKSFIEYGKNLIDKLNAWHIKSEKIKVDEFVRTTYSLHFYDSILLIEKRAVKPPRSEMKGNIIIPLETFPTPSIVEIKKKENLFRLKIFKSLKMSFMFFLKLLKTKK